MVPELLLMFRLKELELEISVPGLTLLRDSACGYQQSLMKLIKCYNIDCDLVKTNIGTFSLVLASL